MCSTYMSQAEKHKKILMTIEGSEAIQLFIIGSRHIFIHQVDYVGTVKKDLANILSSGNEKDYYEYITRKLITVISNMCGDWEIDFMLRNKDGIVGGSTPYGVRFGLFLDMAIMDAIERHS